MRWYWAIIGLLVALEAFAGLAPVQAQTTSG